MFIHEHYGIVSAINYLRNKKKCCSLNRFVQQCVDRKLTYVKIQLDPSIASWILSFTLSIQILWPWMCRGQYTRALMHSYFKISTYYGDMEVYMLLFWVFNHLYHYETHRLSWYWFNVCFNRNIITERFTFAQKSMDLYITVNSIELT